MGRLVVPAQLHIMNQNLLHSYMSSRQLNMDERPLSPFSDAGSDIQNHVQHQLSLGSVVQAPPLCGFLVPDPVSPNYMVLNTRFVMDARQNKTVPYPREYEARKAYTDQQRLYALNAQVPKGSDDFARMVRVI